SCDETAAAVIDQDRCVLSNIVATQHTLHERFGGVVPEIASRAHVERVLPVIDEALKNAGTSLGELTAIAVATQPGLVGSLLVGLTAAKSLAWALNIPLLAINHVAAHLYACRLSAGADAFPCVGFVVSGGHTHLYDCQSPVEFQLLGATIDDAAGEAFDKVGQILGLDYPGGPLIEALARNGNPNAVALPRSFLHDPQLKFSFSGLKTAVLYAARGTPGSRETPPPLTDQRRADIAASFQAATIDILIRKCEQALVQTGRTTLCVGGGVAANSTFRAALQELCSRRDIRLIIAPREFCTDNAAMGAIGWELYERGLFAPLDADVTPGLMR
ncbi:MAG: tRNA (adenosine(37)-N6)-threonylcarbamoyltransferase complex transferase subunit TsaD, partial [Planctomycetaceae bacterium]|nr:tRNA (adenosine(37)-N6)-threonylcarbamoyltransferase complex transferase subunit TsaD [Planctomycetaceae bacterium]